MTYADEATKENVRLIKAIDANPDIAQETKEVTREYTNFMKARGLTDRTIRKNLYCLSNFYKVIGNKPVLSLTRKDIEAAMAQIEATKYAIKTKQNIKLAIKGLFKHFLGNDEFYPEQVRWIKATLQERKRLLPENILTEDDILQMLNATSDVRDKAIIALLYDSGMRVGELLSMRIESCDLESTPAHVTVNGKTGMRKVPILFSSPYLAAYLNTVKGKKPTDYLWNARGSWSNKKHPIDRSGVAKMLKLAAERAAVTKAVNPHAFRHARATYYANKLTEQQLKAFFGWTADSTMASTYVHLSGRDLDNKVLEVNGMKPAEDTMPRLKVKICPKCGYANGIDMKFCGRCGSPLDIDVAMQQEHDANNVSAALGKAIESGNINEAIEGLAQLILKADYEKKKRKKA